MSRRVRLRGWVPPEAPSKTAADPWGRERPAGWLSSLMVAVLMMPVCILIMTAALRAWLPAELRLRSAGRKTIGTVIGIRTDWASEGGETSVPVVKFKAADGTAHTFTGGGADGPTQVGQTLPVIYDPLDPKTARIDTWWGRNGPPALLALTMPLVLAGVIVWAVRSLRTFPRIR